MWDFFTPQERDRIGQAVDSAPSVLNEHPWLLRIVASDRVELHLKYPVPALSLLRREAWISCGAALYNLRLAIRVAGHAVNEVLVPDPGRDGTLVATVEIVTGRVAPATDAERELYAAIPHRRTSRVPFNLLRVPVAYLVEMENAAAAEDGWLRIVPPGEAKRLLRAEAGAERQLTGVPRDFGPVVKPLGWVPPDENARTRHFRSAFGRLNKVPTRNYGPAPERPEYPPTRSDFWFPERRRFERKRDIQLMTLSTDDDRPLDWVRAGLALQHALLTATRFSMAKRYGRIARYSAPRRFGFPARRAPGRWDHQVPAEYGIAVSPLTGLLELDDLHGRPRHWPWRAYYPEIPQMLIRVGYASGPLPPKPPGTQLSRLWDDRRPSG